MKRVNHSDEPTVGQMIRMADNLQNLPRFTYASMDLEVSKFPTGTLEVLYKLILQPGLDGTSCSIHRFISWADCQDMYFKLIGGDS